MCGNPMAQDTQHQPALHLAPPGTGRIAGLDGLRGIAAMMVVLSHLKHALRHGNELAGQQWDLWFLSWPIRLLWGGDEALICFFVLSGFVLAQPFLRPASSPWAAFARRRLARLYPAYLAALLLSAWVAWMLQPYRDATLDIILEGYPKPEVTALALAGNALLLMDLNDVNPALWALVVAIRVALVFPFLFAAIRWLGAGLSLGLSAALSMAVVAILTAAPPLHGWAEIGASLLKTGYFLFFFVLGSVLALHRQILLARLTGPWREGRLAFAIIGVGLLGMKWYLPYMAGPLAVGLGFAIIFLLVQSTPRAGAVLQSAPLTFLGTLSYSLFLVHLRVMYATVYLLHGRLPLGVILPLVLPLALLAAWLFWLMVERPSLSWGRAMIPLRRQFD